MTDNMYVCHPVWSRVCACVCVLHETVSRSLFLLATVSDCVKIMTLKETFEEPAPLSVTV